MQSFTYIEIRHQGILSLALSPSEFTVGEISTNDNLFELEQITKDKNLTNEEFKELYPELQL